MNETQLSQVIQSAVSAGVQAGMSAGRNNRKDFSRTIGFKAPAAFPTANLMHGPGGLFGIAGLDNNVLSLRITPMGISSALPAFPDVYMNPLFPYITGVIQDPDLNEPATRCETCISGETEACLQTAQFGRVCRETQTMEPSRIIERVNSGEVDLTLVNDILGHEGDVLAAIRNYDRNTVLNVATLWAMLEVGILLQNALVPMYFQGNPVNNVGTGYMEFPGLAMLVGVNKFDAITGARCNALDSDVKEFAYQHLRTVDANGNFIIVRMLHALEQYVYHNATRQQLLPCTWVWCMRAELWQELTEIWPVAYMSTRNITLPAGNTNFIDATRMNEMRDQMREGMFLYTNGRRHDVVIDDGIFEHTNVNDQNLQPGQFASDIFLIPLTYQGNKPATYIQHKDYRQTGADLRAARLNDEIWTDDGRFLWTNERLKYCYTVTGAVEPRVILKTPQIAGRLNHVMYQPEQHFRDWDQDSDYFFKGGISMRDLTPYYSDWNIPVGYR